jgi:hypothetical protein
MVLPLEAAELKCEIREEDGVAASRLHELRAVRERPGGQTRSAAHPQQVAVAAGDLASAGVVRAEARQGAALGAYYHRRLPMVAGAGGRDGRERHDGDDENGERLAKGHQSLLSPPCGG